MYVDILVLALLDRQPRHGYEIKKRVEAILGGRVPINNNTLYPTLRRLEQMQAITKEVERQEGRPDRHVYRLTEYGMDVLQDLLRDFPPNMAADDVEFLVRVGFFHMLDSETRQRILDARRAVLSEQLALLNGFADHTAYDMNVWHSRILSFLRDQTQREADWVDGLAREAEDDGKD